MFPAAAPDGNGCALARGRDFEAFMAGAPHGLLRYAFLLTGNAAKAEDLTQETLIRVYEARRRIEAGGHPAYARRTMYNLSVSWWRRVKDRERPLPPGYEGAPAPAPGDAYDERDATPAAIRTLPVRMRAAILLHYFEDLSPRQRAAHRRPGEPAPGPRRGREPEQRVREHRCGGQRARRAVTARRGTPGAAGRPGRHRRGLRGPALGAHPRPSGGGAPRVLVAGRLDLAVVTSEDTDMAETLDLAPGGTRSAARGIPGAATVPTPDGKRLVTSAAVVDTETPQVVARLAGRPPRGRSVVWDTGFVAPADIGSGLWFTCSRSGATHRHRLTGFPPSGR